MEKEIMKNAIVTGGAGFVGSNLCKKLKELGVNVLSVDNYSNGFIEHHVDGVKYIKADVLDIPKMITKDGKVNYFENDFIKPDIVFHLAEFCRAEQSVVYPIQTIYNTYHTLPCIIDLCHKTGAKLMYAGSSTKFGDGQSPYATSKKMNTLMVKDICTQLGIDYAITYFYNVYGHNEPATGLFAMLIAKSLRAKKLNEKITVTAPGNQKRFFTHVEDIIEGLLLVAEKGCGDEYGIGSDDEYSVLEVMDMIGCEYEIGMPKLGNRMGSELKSEKTKALGWKPKKNLPDYIIQQIKSEKNYE
jgi:UDP-glucose 4-epimerase